MTRKDYELIAHTMADMANAYRGNEQAIHAIYQTAEIFAVRLKADNPRFDPVRFMAECQLEAAA